MHLWVRPGGQGLFASAQVLPIRDWHATRLTPYELASVLLRGVTTQSVLVNGTTRVALPAGRHSRE